MRTVRSGYSEFPRLRGGVLYRLVLVLAIALAACALAVSVGQDAAWAEEQPSSGLNANSADGSPAPAGDFLVEGGVEGADWSYSDNVLAVLTGTPLTISMGMATATVDDRIVIDTSTASTAAGATVAAKLKFNAVSIDTKSTGDKDTQTVGKPPVHVLSGALDLELEGETALVTAYGCACLQNGENALTIGGTGKLSAEAANTSGLTDAAAIGGGIGESGSNITINGGTVIANTFEHAAGIGGGKGGDGTNITIEDGTVEAACAYGDGAGIGGGQGGDGVNITINGGSVEAGCYSKNGAGIGGGQGGSGANITINGGTVVASGSTGGAGIGAGSSGGNAENILITGGVVAAKAYSYGAGIGGAYGTEIPSGPGYVKNISITGGEVTASTAYGCAAIGGALYGSVDGITIKNAKVRAEVENGGGAAIGSGDGYGSEAANSARNIVIENSKVTAIAKNGGAGIGGGGVSPDGATVSGITIRNSTVVATGGSGSGAAIGGGGGVASFGGGEVSNIIIENSIVTATGGSGAAAIGGGWKGGDVSGVVIHGGQLTAAAGAGADVIGDGGESTAAHDAEVSITGGVFGGGTLAKDDIIDWIGDVYAVSPAAGYAVVANANTATVASYPFEVVGQTASSASVSAPSGLVYTGLPVDGSGFTARASHGLADASSSAILEYKAAGETDAAYSTSLPTGAGAYTVRASVGAWATEDVAYAGASDTADFAIARALFSFDGPADQTVSVGAGLGSIAAPEAKGVTVSGIAETVQGSLTWYADAARTQPLDSRFVFSGDAGSTATLHWTFVPADSNYVSEPVDGFTKFTLANTDPGDDPSDLGDKPGSDPSDSGDKPGGDGGTGVHTLPAPKANTASLPSVGDACSSVVLVVASIMAAVFAVCLVSLRVHRVS